MKILMVLPFLKAGGTERQASYIVNYLQHKGNHVRTLCIEKKGPFRDLFQVPIDYLNSINSNSRFLINIYLFLTYLRGKKIDFIISRAWSTNILTGVVSIISRKPCILFLSGSIDLSEHSVLKKWIFMFVLKRCAWIISVSEASKKNCVKWLSIDPNKIVVIHNGVNLEWVAKMSEMRVDLPEGYDSDFKTITFVGSLIHRKGVDVLLQSIKNVLQGKNLNVIIVGDGELRDNLESLSRELNINNHVFFVGEKVNPFPYMKLGCIFVLPSRAEGFPNVLLEAMALDNAVIATDCKTGPIEIIDGSNGTLIPVDDAQTLTEAIMSYLEKPELVKEHSFNAFKTLEKDFQLDHQLSKFKNLIQGKIRDRPS